jgi:hypothetical protein
VHIAANLIILSSFCRLTFTNIEKGISMTKEPVFYTEELGQEICQEISISPVGINVLCERNPHWPTQRIVHLWTLRYEDFGRNYARAKARQIDVLVEEALRIAYDSDSDTIIDEKGRRKCDHEWVARSRLKIDTIKWIACKLAPKVYGDKVQIENTDSSTDPSLIKARMLANELMKKNTNGQSDTTES